MAERGRTFWSFIAVAIALAAVFVRLGVWQLERLSERRGVNDERAVRLAEPNLDRLEEAVDVPADRVVWRRVTLTGVYDYDREVVLFGRARRGVPGVHVATPLRVRDTLAVMVLRGWLPAADGFSAELGAGRPEGGRAVWLEEVTVEGTVLPFPAAESPGTIEREIDGAQHLVTRLMEPKTIEASLPYSIAGWYMLAGGEAPAGSALRMIPSPELNDGPHLAYAIQWFAFAVIAVVGALVFARRRAFVEHAPHT
jgi:surfeit locus 1 family protein